MPSFFPWWVVITHFLNLFLMLLLFRSGLEVLSALPKLYWDDDCHPGHEWLRLSGGTYSADSRTAWSSLSEERAWSPLVALPGRRNLGLGRHWHFLSIQFWILTGIVYLVMVFVSGYWHYLVPTSWSIIPDSISSIGTYLQFDIPAKIPGEPFEPAQKLAYFVVIFIMAPLQILTGAAMSPSVLARFPFYGRLFHGKQGARSMHFIIMCAFAAFTVVHVALVVIHGVAREFTDIVLAGQSNNHTLALAIGLSGLALIVVFHVVITVYSLRRKRRTQRLLGWIVNPLERILSSALTSRQRYAAADISPYFRVNGYPPPDPAFQRLAAEDFTEYRLPIGGLVQHPVSLTLDELRALGMTTYVSKHNCIQGWTAVAEWGGVPLPRIVERVQPTAEARHVVFYAFDDKGLTEGEGRYGHFYGSIPVFLASNPQAILALDMNGVPLPLEHGAPVRLRLETQLGFKMVKWIKAIEFVADTADIGQGQGGWREDQQYYANAAGI